uniref:Clp protease proteolytic subunit n=1 Tax=Corydalis lathyrophylla TaxID=2952651 RepID=UPI0021150920|nr:Clp protease proteolytic subunit [Corydalis lathyrophylla]USG57825.1 Clp protease proteolytic subunit [Corydalis lathyrophylla]
MPVGVPKSLDILQEDEEEKKEEENNKLHKTRTLLLCQKLDAETGNNLKGLLVTLSLEKPKHKFFILVNCIGGSLKAGISLFDMMQMVSPEVHTICVAQAFSMGSLIVSGGAISHRLALPHSRLMMHEPVSTYLGRRIGELQEDADEFRRVYKKLIYLYSITTLRTERRIRKDLRKSTFMTPKEAKKHGIVDHVGVVLPGSYRKSAESIRRNYLRRLQKALNTNQAD